MRSKRPVDILLRTATCVALMATMTLMACAEEIPERDAPPDRVEAVFDPATEVIPLPNDAAMQDGRLPGLSGAEEETAAGELSDYMKELRGWPRTTPIEIPFSGPLDEDTITEESVRMYRIDDEGVLHPVPVAERVYSEADDGSASSINIIPVEPPAAGERFSVVATNDLIGANGHSVGASLPVFLAASEESLLDEDGQPALSILADDQATAQTLEGLRLLLAPVFEQIEEGVGDEDAIDRDDVISAFRWTTMPDTTVAFFPDAQELPLPNTAALDADGTFPDAATCYLGEDSPNGVFDEYLAGLSGWPNTTPITLTLTGPVDPDSIGDDDVQLWKSAGGDWERVDDVDVSYRDFDIDRCTGEEFATHLIEIVPTNPEDIETHSQYFAFATRNIEPVGDQDELIPEVPLFLALQPYPLVDEEGNSLLSTLDDESAQTLTGLRQMLEPAMDTIETEAGLDYTDLAAVFSWYTWNDTFVTFDPTSGQAPFPLVALMGDDGTVDLPIPDGADPGTQSLLTALNQRRGFSRSAPGWVPLQGEVDPETITPDSVRFASQSEFVFWDEDELHRSYEPQWGRLVYEPQRPLRPNHGYLGLITQDLIGGNGRPVQPSQVFVFLKMEDPVFEDGESQVWAVDDEQAEELEDFRLAIADLMTLVDILPGVSRSTLAGGWAFDTEDPVESLREYRALAMHELAARADLEAYRACDAGGDCTDDEDYLEPGAEIEHPRSPGVMVDMDNVGAAHLAGEFESLTFDVSTGTVSDTGDPVGISVFLPDEEECTAPYDVVISQHGLGADRWQAGFSLANDLAGDCLATVAMDLPLHGGRSPSATTLHPDELPADTGLGFLGPNFVESKGNFVQSMVDLFVLTQIIGDDGLDPLFADLGAGPYFSDEIGYVGISLGGIVGVPFVAVEPAIEAMALHSAGGRLSWILQGDEEGPSTIGEPLLDQIGLDADDPALFEAMVFVQWLADRIDPFIYGEVVVDGEMPTLMYDEGEDSFDPTTAGACDDDVECDDGWTCESDLCTEMVGPKDVMMQMSEGDRTIVNRSTEALATQMGVSLEDTTFEDVPHTFINEVDEDSDNFSAGQCARLQASQWIRSGLTGDAVLPDELAVDQCL